jgi:hypothetical protein
LIYIAFAGLAPSRRDAFRTADIYVFEIIACDVLVQVNTCLVPCVFKGAVEYVWCRRSRKEDNKTEVFIRALNMSEMREK